LPSRRTAGLVYLATKLRDRGVGDEERRERQGGGREKPAYTRSLAPAHKRAGQSPRTVTATRPMESADAMTAVPIPTICETRPFALSPICERSTASRWENNSTICRRRQLML